ncbi:hypothetical protein M413DRAFT_30365 [Hebeloma cylindrosporum]|uniref:Mid2 domain-containing protein n=1 Tax=Hebeloma cylindrosporum TaxID=76867 RepID=A0A0C3C3T8_HEBCY|nr:hypothetical protein M413DRAFT_30365 [Hebeloma cylindrosporum h7]
MRQNRRIAKVCGVLSYIASGYAQPVGKDLVSGRSRVLAEATSLESDAVPTSPSIPVDSKTPVDSAIPTTHISSSKASSSPSAALHTTISPTPVVNHSTRSSSHTSSLSSTASIFNSTTATTGVVSLPTRTSKVAYLSIGVAMAGFFVILIVALIVSMSRRRKRRHSFLIPGIRHPFRPANIARVDEDPFSGLGYSDWPYSRLPPTTSSRYTSSTIPASSTSVSSPNLSATDHKKTFSQCSPPLLEDEEELTTHVLPPIIQITFDWERSQPRHSHRPHNRTTWRWSRASQTFTSILPMAMLRP